MTCTRSRPDRRRTLLWLAAVLLAAGCQGPPRGRAQVVSFSPSGPEVSDAQLAGGLRLVFDRRVAPAGALGDRLTAALRISPPVEGEARWLDPQTLVFFPANRLRPSTAYSVSLDRRLAIAPDVAIADWKGARFVHQRIEIAAVTFATAVRYQPARPVVTVRASQPVRPSDAIVACAFHPLDAEGKPGARVVVRQVLARAEDEEAPAGDGASRLLRLRPVDALAAGTAYVFRCDGRFRPGEGGEGIARVHETRLATLGPAALEAVVPSGDDLPADDVQVALTFATPMNPRQVRAHVQLSRQDEARWIPVRLELAGDAEARVFAWRGDLEPGSNYRVTIKDGLKDAFGQALAAPGPHTFHVGAASPRLRMEEGLHVIERASGRYPIWTRNLTGGHRVRCAAVPGSQVAEVMETFSPGGDPREIDGVALARQMGLSVREHSFTGKPGNRWVDASLPLRARCGGGPSGVYLLEVITEADNRRRRALANVTDLGLLAKVGSASSLVWVVRLSTGRAVAGATVEIRNATGKVLFTGKSNADGVVMAPGASQLLGQAPALAESDDPGAARTVVTARAGDELALLDTRWQSGIQSWSFGADVDRGGGRARVRGFLHSDRGLYRPGDTVHLRGLVRQIDGAGQMSVPRGKQRRIKLVIADPRGATLLQEELAISAYGAFSRDLVLAAEAHLGDYRVSGELEGQTFSERFSVEEYRPRTFEVKLVPAQKDVFQGKPMKFSLAAHYLHGGALRDAKVTWSIRRRPYPPQFTGFAGFSFLDEAAVLESGRPWGRHEERSFSELVADGELTLDAAGKGTITSTDAARGLAGPQHYLIQASVQDVNGDEVTVAEVVTGHRSNLYLGVQSSEWVQSANRPFDVQLVAFDGSGKRRAASARLTVTRRSYTCDDQLWSGCERNPDDSHAVDRLVAVGEAGSPLVEKVVLKAPGEYLVRVTADDGRGHQALANQLIYVVGPGEGGWSGDENPDRMTVIASKPRYRAGDTARLVPQARMPGAQALVTLERDGVLSYSTRTLGDGAEALDVAIEPRLAPNAFASVVLVRGRSGPGEDERPRFRMGMVNLIVDSADHRLAVSVETDRPSYRPGDRVQATIKVTGSDGAPVKGELALAVADEGVLQIAGFKTPDPLPAFYASWGLGVASSTSWNRLLWRRAEPVDDDPDDEDEVGIGDAAGEEAGRIRSRFMATAFWAPSLVTDGAGVARVSFRAPDDLTAFRVMAVVADTGARFGGGERRFTVRKPLQVVPSLPRFLTVGDTFEAAVVLHNHSGGPLTVALSAAVEGLTLVGAADRTVKLPSGGLQRVTFPVAARTAGPATFVFRAAGAEHRDAVQVKIPVASAGTPEVLSVGEGAATGKVEHALPALGASVPGRTRLEVSLDATGLGRLEEGLRYLVEYPHGCLEQTTSKMVPMISLTELGKAVALSEVSASEARGYVEAGIAKVLRHQHEDGGFGLWPGTPPEVHYTAYGLWGLQVARAAGYAVNAGALDRGAGYLRRHLATPPDASGDRLLAQGGDEAFSAYVLASLGRPDQTALNRLFNQRRQLPMFGRALVARALAAAGRGSEAATLADELAALLPPSGPAMIREGGPDLSWQWSSDARTTALVLSALMEARPGHPAIARLAEGLLAGRSGGRWAGTQENLHSLLALAQLARVRAAADVKATVRLGGRVLAERSLAGHTHHLRLPIADGAAGPLVITAEGGSVFYAARVRLERPLATTAAADHGLHISRVYLDPQSDVPLSGLKVGQVAKVRVTVHAKERQAHVAVIDRLPAGVEPVLTRFAPTIGSTGAGLREGWWQAQTAWQHEQLRDDRAEVFADVLAPGESVHHYYVRAVAAGTFAAAPATAEAMYRPTVRGQSDAAILEVLP